MTRQATFSQIQGHGAGHGGKGAPVKEFPRKGTLLRYYYDLFQDNKGEVIELAFGRNTSSRIIPDLIDYHGFDLRCVKKGGPSCNSKWLLAGEWIGKIYIDYVVGGLK